MTFRQFDAVVGYRDHYYANATEGVNNPSNNWIKKVQQEWKILEKDLPDTILIRVYEERMDLLRAVIIGPAGTPYHDGLFFFDFQFPGNYPYSPPKAYYHSGGLRLNPNLYANGRVCLSLLNTWTGKKCEKWDPQQSTMLQVLVSIQALVLNAKPYFNEPGIYDRPNTRRGEKKSLAYNESAFLLSCRTMLYSLRRPPMHFKDFVAEHFRKQGDSFLMACTAYLDGTCVGCAFEGERQGIVKVGKGCSEDFKTKLQQLSEELLKEFTVKGVDCNEYLAKKAAIAAASAAPEAVTVNGEKVVPQKAKASNGLLNRLRNFFCLTQEDSFTSRKGKGKEK